MEFMLPGFFYFTAFISTLVGVYYIYINFNSYLNKLVFLYCISLSCWFFGTAASIMASNCEDGLIWRRFAAIGSGTFFSFLLHFIILLTENNDKMKIWVKYLIYFPAIVYVYLGAISLNANNLYRFYKTRLGWISVENIGFVSVFYHIYIICLLLIGIYYVSIWKKRNSEKQINKHACFILMQCLLMIVLTILDITLEYFKASIYFNQFVPFILIIQVKGMCYAINKNDFMKAPVGNDDSIFMMQFRTKITSYLSIGFCFGGVIYFLTEYMEKSNPDFRKVISFSLLLFGTGLVTFLFQKYIKKVELKVIFYSFLLFITIPIITLHFMKSAAITVWAFPFIIIIATLLFKNSTTLTMVATSMIITQLYIWISVSEHVVVVRNSDYFLRVGLAGMAIWLVNYINKIYLLRLNQLYDKIRTQELLFLISSEIIEADCDNFPEKMDKVLKLLCNYIEADRAHIYYNTSKEEGITELSWWKSQIKEVGFVQITDVSKLPEPAYREKEILVSQNVKSMLAVPLSSHEDKIGFLRVDYVLESKNWDKEFIKLLMTVGNILGETSSKIIFEKKLEKMAYYDQLTNVPNRQLFGQRLNQAMNLASKTGSLFGVIFLDVDSFKIVNDTIGHHVGDKMLVIIAEKLLSCVRSADTVCRFGGDEFLILISNIESKEELEVVSSKIMKQFVDPIVIDGYEYYITVSIGISIYPNDGEDMDTLIKNADIAVYNAKTIGKNQVVFCSEEMKEETQHTMLLTNYLYHAQENNELRVVYQPQVSVESGKMIAIEALARWEHPELGMITPSKFIPIAERTGLINSIGEWILREACKQNRIWREMGLAKIRMAVNVSVNQLLSPDFIGIVQEVIKENQIEPGFLELEITENIAIQESHIIIEILSKLKEIGVSLAIDDFGVEYSSLSRIKMLPVDRLKIDMNFIRGIFDNDKDKAIVDIIIKLAKDLGLKVIAEGVEKEEQYLYLKEKLCDEIQGYYFYEPMSKESVAELLRLGDRINL